MNKTCSKCGETKPLDEFHLTKYSRDGHVSRCKPCAVRLAAAWNRDNPKRRRRNSRASSRKIKYGLTAEAEAHLVNDQACLCAACRCEFKLTTSRAYHIDHCHTTGRVRGLLCAGCNVALGHARDDVPRLRALNRYLERA